jgi:hypothetical protein
MTRLELENAILELIDTQDDYTRSDLQGVVGALAITVKMEGVQ